MNTFMIEWYHRKRGSSSRPQDFKSNYLDYLLKEDRSFERDLRSSFIFIVAIDAFVYSIAIRF